MRLSHISIKNYKCHKNIENLPFHILTTIIGENDSGKTAIIDFLEIMLTTKVPNENEYHREIFFNPENKKEEEKVASVIEGILVFDICEERKKL